MSDNETSYNCNFMNVAQWIEENAVILKYGSPYLFREKTKSISKSVITASIYVFGVLKSVYTYASYSFLCMEYDTIDFGKCAPDSLSV